jgi:hypothetical protein
LRANSSWLPGTKITLVPLRALRSSFLHHVVVRLRPVPAAPQLPAVDDVAHQVQRLAVHRAQEVQQRCGLAAGRAQVQVGDPHVRTRSDPSARPACRRAVVKRCGKVVASHGIFDVAGRHETPS